LVKIRRPFCPHAAVPLPRSAFRWLPLALSLAGCLLPGGALAEDAIAEEPAAAAPVSHPSPITIAVRYPPEASGNATVSMSFVVDVDGTVKDPEVEVGDEPFASAAVAATKSWRFVPAQVDGQPVAVRIAMEVRFTEEERPAPAAELPGAAPAPTAEPHPSEPDARTATPEPAGTAIATVDQATDITIEGDRAPGTVSYSRAEARQVPGAFGDPLRAIDSMAGVSPLVSGLPLFYLRGAPPGNIGYFVDEIRLPFLFHAFLGPSVINAELIERVNLYPSWYPARYGGFAGGVVEAELRAPRYEETYSLGVGLWEAGAFMEAPFAEDRGNVFVGGRYAFTGLLLSALTPNTIEYWNYQALAEYDLGKNDKARVFLLGAFDYFEDPENNFLGTEFHRLDLKLQHRFSTKTLAYGGVTLGVDRTRLDQARVLDQLVAGRLRVNHRVDEEFVLRTGIDATVDSFDLALDASARTNNYDNIRSLFPARQDVVFGGFVDSTWQPTKTITVIPGVRADVYSSGGDTAVGVDPKISARFKVRPKLALVHTAGLTHQPPNYVPTIPGVRVAGLEGGLQKSLHASSGVELELPDDWRAGAAVFDNVYMDLTDPYSQTQDFGLDPDIARRRLLGHAYGAEFEFRRPLTRRFGAMLTYTLSRSTRSYDYVETIAGSDRPHVLNLAGMYTLGKNWRVAARSVFYSGVPGRLSRFQRFPYSRSDPFFRLDLRLERRFRLGPRSWWSLIAEALNVTASEETLTRTCDVNGCRDRNVGPVFLPNVKLEAQF
jgi:TonB family protein